MTGTISRDTVDVAHEDVVALLACQTEVLELMSAGASLAVMLDAITAALERLMPASRCSLLVLDEASGALRHGSAPSLPAAYSEAIDGLMPGPGEGSCGSAAYLCAPVIVEDIGVDERWDRYRDLADAAGLRACWSSPVLGSTGAVVGTFAVYHDTPHRPTAREHHVVDRLTYLASVAIGHAALFGALAVSEERFRRAFEDTAVPMALLDTAGRLTRVNGALLALTELPVADAVGTPFAAVLADDDRDRFAECLAAVREGRARSVDCELQVGASAVSATLSLVRGAASEPAHVSVTMLDITARLAAQRERRARHEAEVAQRTAEAASRAKSAFLSAVSHEMRTPLQAITGFAELIGTLDLDVARRREALDHITTGASHLLELVDDTLDLARIEADALPLTSGPVPVASVIAEVVEFLAPVAEQHAVGLCTAAAAGTVIADHRRLRQVLINLVSNGLRYSGSDGRVRVGAVETARDVRIEVIDNGPGIAPHLREGLFEPFARLEPTVRRADAPGGDGVGLGLMLARGLTEAMGGRLVLDGALGGGTVAAVVLPRAESLT